MIKILELEDIRRLVSIAKNECLSKPWVLRLGNNVVISGDSTNYLLENNISLDYCEEYPLDKVCMGTARSNE